MRENISNLIFLLFVLVCLIATYTCKKLEKSMLVSTGEITNITTNSADASGQVINLGGGATQYGHCYATTPNPTTASPKTKLGAPAGIGGFSSQLTNLLPGIKYYIKAYISNGNQTVYGEEITFSTVASLTVTDYDGNIYNTITIGTQVWIARNLETTKYKDGTPIPFVFGVASWWSGLTSGGYCWYNDDTTTFKATYGPLYNWYTANTGKLCPAGWHVPTDADWTTLVAYLGGESIAGGKLKETGTTHWNSPNSGATNEKSFTALPRGSRERNGTYSNIGKSGNWWSATQSDATYVRYRNVSYSDSSLIRSSDSKEYGFSVRCVRDY